MKILSDIKPVRGAKKVGDRCSIADPLYTFCLKYIQLVHISFLLTLQLWHPYSSTDMTLLLKSRSLVFRLYTLDFHMLHRLQ